MTSSSRSSTQKSFMYDVFLSFRGEDTRKNFVDHLYHALERQGIHTYKDDERLHKGKRIKDELMKSIEDSKFHIVVFSKNYASSSWCLDELVKIMECRKEPKQIAYPVFYDVDPSEVHKQVGPVGEAFATHKNKGEVKKWREALKEAANLAGWDLRNTADGHEAKVINKIVENILLELQFINLEIDENLIGMESRVKEIVSDLDTGFEDVRMIGIKGIGGGGKTTLARAVFDNICFSFEGRSFLENVREVSKASLSGLRSLQEQVLFNVFHGRSFILDSVHEGKKLMKKMLRGKKVLLVLDDVDHLDQLEALAGGLDWFKPGSRIIITTRDEQVLIAHRVKSIHDVNLFSPEEATCLFSRYAFGNNIPIQIYKELSQEVVHYAAGLPLTIRVLGSFLHGKSELEWIDAIERLKTIPLKETLDKLELSYTSLEDDYKEIFLDVACLLKGWPKEDAIRALESCGFHARIGLRVLEQKSLITISPCQQLGMHDHIQEMGQNIVRRSRPNEPITHSRLWIKREIEDVLADHLDMEATIAIATNISSWDMEDNPHSMILTKGFGSMKKLRFLHVVSNTCYWPVKMEVGQNFPNGLQFLSWPGYYLWCLPTRFQANNLVALIMPHSRINRLWEDGEDKVLKNLRFLDLSYSKLVTLDCGLLPNLETLNLENCDHLVELYAPIGSMRRLVYLDLNHCNRLDFVTFIEQLELLQVFKNLRFVNFSYSDRTTVGLLPRLLDLKISNHEKYRHLVSSHMPIEHVRKLVCLDLKCWKGFTSLSFIKQMKPLHVLDLSDLYLREFPDILPRHSSSLLELNFSSNNIEELPSSIGNLQKLVSLDLNGCKNLKSLPNSICMLKHLKVLRLAYCRDLRKLPEDIGLLESLEVLSLEFCKIRDIPKSICKLKSLREFNLRCCDQLEKLPEKLGDLECLEELNVEGTCISHLPQSIYLLKRVSILGFTSRDSSIYNAPWIGANPALFEPPSPSKTQRQRGYKRKREIDHTDQREKKLKI